MGGVHPRKFGFATEHGAMVRAVSSHDWVIGRYCEYVIRDEDDFFIENKPVSQEWKSVNLNPSDLS
jgi:hypothetical protein